MNYEEAISFIHSVEWRGSKPGLERITELLAMMGNPEKGIRAVHVAGTNGKGSFCAMTESILRCAGYKTGLFTSPYIEFFEERMQIGGELIPKDELAEIVTYISQFTEKMEDKPTEFELNTAIGFEFFKRHGIDVAVIECGMGGKLDSTNVIDDPLLSVITGISLDHVQFLGNTLTLIAGEKAGIIKPGCPVLFGGNCEEAETVITETASRLGSRYVKKDLSKLSNIRYTPDGTFFDFDGETDYFIPLLGAYQPENAATVLTAVGMLRERGLDIPEMAVRGGLASVSWKGRFEKLHSDPDVYFDGGHNEEGVTAAVRTVKLYFGEQKISIISGVMHDKDYMKIASEIATVADTVFTVKPSNPRAMDANEYAEVFRSFGANAVPCPSFEDAVKAAFENSKAKNIPLLCVGSLYSYADFKKAIRSITERTVNDNE